MCTCPRKLRRFTNYRLTRPLVISCYSAYEHSTLSTFSSSRSSSSVPATATATIQNIRSANLPPDISLETIISVVFICVGLVSGAEDLKPISWRVWAGIAERESGGGGPYQGLEDRIGFVNIRVSKPFCQKQLLRSTMWDKKESLPKTHL